MTVKQGMSSRGSAVLQNCHLGEPATAPFVKSFQSLHYFHLILSKGGKSSYVKGVFYF